MRRSMVFCLAMLIAFGLPVRAQQSSSKINDNYSHPESSSSTSASKDDVNQLRSEVASQKQTIDELKTMVGRLAQQLATNGTPQVVNATLLQPGSATAALGQASQGMTQSQQAENPTKVPEKKKKEPGKLEWTVGDTTVQMYGHADVSYDYVDNGITPAMEATNPFLGPAGAFRANNGWLGQLSSNLSYFGVRGSRKFNDYLTGVFQFETEVSMTDTPGPTSDMQCKYCLGSRDTYVGLQGPWGAIKLGKEDAPYKRTTTGAFDPFLNTIADARSIMGNSGGDNRAEFMGRVSHAIWYESPTYKGVYASVLFSPGQNRSTDSSGYPRGEPNCSGGNGVFTMSLANKGNAAEAADLNNALTGTGAPPDTTPCNDGSINNILSAALTYRGYGLYMFGGYQHHGHVNRLGDAVGVADEAAWKLGAEYTVKATGTTPSFVYEKLKRYAATDVSGALGMPVVFPALNERSRPTATWLALRQKITKKDTLNFSWIHAGKTPGDPGQCAAFDANGACTAFATLGGVAGTEASVRNTADNSSNMYGVGLKHTLTSRMSTYFVYARQANHADAHYDLGAVGHGLIVDKKDFLGVGFTGTRIQGVSGGLTFDF